MSGEDKLFNFMSGLQNWTQVELCCQGARYVQSAMAMADALVDYKSTNNKDSGDDSQGRDGSRKSCKASSHRGNNNGFDHSRDRSGEQGHRDNRQGQRHGTDDIGR
ncbi:unnamed protein product [Spirodela intermedia]|uniref:Uncharacterized protein n=1 Tax=Spirodela intermedia TaxID=51605 RepID=A0A7I8KC16_SPIIN|nr:unnamed protein product [Spirodela intermedia]